MKRVPQWIMVSLLPILLYAATPDKRLTAAIEKAMVDSGQPGLAIAIVQNDKVTYQRAFGQRDRTKALPVTTHTSFYIASSTKSFTALAAKLFSAEQKLDLDAPLEKTIPKLRLPEPLRADRLSVRDLLTHRCGFGNLPVVIRTAFTGAWTDDELFAVLATQSEVRNREFAYDNLGYVLASYAIRQAASESWQDVLAHRVFEPAGMKSATARAADAWKSELAIPYAVTPDGYVEAAPKIDSTMHAAGGIYMNIEDGARWVRVNLANGMLDKKQVFPRRVMTEVHSPQINLSRKFGRIDRFAYGLGWYLGDYEGETLVHHFGSYAGARAHVSFIPDRDLGIVVLANSDSELADSVALFAYDVLLGKADAEAKLQKDVQTLNASFAEIGQSFAAAKKRIADEAKGNPVAPSALTGDFVNDGMGTIQVRERNGQLEATLGILTTPLEHMGGNSFAASWFTGDRPAAVVFTEDGKSLTWQRRTFSKR